MYKILSIILLLLSLTGCVHKMDVEQGNIVTQEMVSQLHTGMSVSQVKNIMGSPILTNTFADNRLDYVYTFKPGRGTMTEKYVTLIFKNGRLIDIRGNMYSAFFRD